MPSLTPDSPKRYACRHIHATGRRCGSPALRNEHFCYHHHHHRPQPIEAIGPYERFDLPDFAFEDRPAIQNTLTLLATRIAQNRVDPARARLILYLAQLASNNLPREPRRPAQPTEKESPAPEPIENPTLDPDLGLLAPELEIPAPEPAPSDSAESLEDLRAELRQARQALEDTPCPHCNLLPPLPHRWHDADFMKLNPHIPHRPKHPTPCKPIVLPTLQACITTAPGGLSSKARPHSGTHHKRSIRSHEAVETLWIYPNRPFTRETDSTTARGPKGLTFSQQP